MRELIYNSPSITLSNVMQNTRMSLRLLLLQRQCEELTKLREILPSKLDAICASMGITDDWRNADTRGRGDKPLAQRIVDDEI